MKRTVFVTAKICNRFFNLIHTGEKRYEVRSAPFEDAQVIVYVSAEDGSFLGMYEIAETMMCDRHNDSETIKLSGISGEEFYELFPPIDRGGASKLWIARIGMPINKEQLLKGETMNKAELWIRCRRFFFVVGSGGSVLQKPS